jgi:hypothetical protein
MWGITANLKSIGPTGFEIGLIEVQILCGVNGEFKKVSDRQDLNLRPLPPQGSALPSCATARQGIMIGQAMRLVTYLS